MDLQCGAPPRPGQRRRTSWVASKRSCTAGTNSANLLTNSPPVDCSLATDPQLHHPTTARRRGFSTRSRCQTRWTSSYNNPEYTTAGGPIPTGPYDPAHVDGWNFHDTYFVTFKQAYLTAIGFDFNNYDDRELRPGDEHLHV